MAREVSPLPAEASLAEPKQTTAARRHPWVTIALAVASLSALAVVVSDGIGTGWRMPRDILCLLAGIAGLSLTAWRVTRVGLRLGTIRSRLQVSFVALALLAAIGASAPTIYVGYFTGQRQALARIDSLASERQVRIRAWKDALLGELRATLGEEYALDRARVVLKVAARDFEFPFWTDATRARLQWQISQSKQIQSYMLIDLEYKVVLSTDVSREGARINSQFPDLPNPSAGFVLLPFCSGGSVTPVILAGIPVTDSDGTLLGALVAAVSTDGLYSIVGESTGLGESGEAYLVDTGGQPLVWSAEQSLPGPKCQSQEGSNRAQSADLTKLSQQGGSGVFVSYRGRQVIGAMRPLEDLEADLVVEQDLGASSRPIYLSLVVNVVVALGFALFAVLAALFITRSITRPLVSLADTASRIAARDLDLQAPVERSDEVGALAIAFNSMTRQLRDLIGGLEARVAERTRALQVRAVQLETSADVSREISSILDIDELLRRVVDRIRDAFGYYHVQVFLADGEMRSLAMRAASGPEGGPLRTLGIGQGSLNGEAAASNRAILVNDVTRDSRFRPDEHLPETRSELVVPLRISDRLLGTLDVHSVRAGAFTPEDVLVIQGLGDQIAVAIENARLYERSRGLAAMEERNRLARELHDSVTQSLYCVTLFAEAGADAVEAGDVDASAHLYRRIGGTAQQALRDLRLALYQLRSPAPQSEGLAAALQQRFDAVERRSGLAAELVVQGRPRVDPATEADMFRIAQEALNNVVKHSGATSVWVRLTFAEGEILLEIEDNGRGFDVEAARQSGGMGLGTMRERAEARGGVLEVFTAPGQGARLRASFPAAPMSS